MKILRLTLLLSLFCVFGATDVFSQEESIIDNSKIVYEFQTENTFNQFHLPTVSVADLTKADLDVLQLNKEGLERKITAAQQEKIDVSALQVQLKKLTDAIELK